MAYTESLARALREKRYGNRRLVVEIDDRDIGGARGWEWIKKGIPLRVEIGPRDIANDSVFVARRDKSPKEKTAIGRARFIAQIDYILDDIQHNIFNRALVERNDNMVKVDDHDDFYQFFTPKNQKKPEIHGGFAMSHWCGDDACEAKIKDDLKVTIRCIPFDNDKEDGKCICCGQPSRQRVVFAKAY